MHLSGACFLGVFMRKSFVLFFIIIRCILTSPILAASNKGSDDSREDRKEKSGLRLIYSPIAYFSPETNLAYGIAGSGIFRLDRGINNPKPSSISALLVHTRNKQLKMVATVDMYFNELGIRIRPEVTYQDYPDKFFGIGSDTLPEDEELYTSRKLEISVLLEKRIWRDLSFGIRFQRDNFDITETVSGGLLDSPDTIGITGGRVTGFGLNATWDSRDRLYSPSRGTLAKIRGDLFMRGLGGDYDFSHLIMDLRRYLTLSPGHVLALQCRMELESGEVPFSYLASFGGMYAMRGYYDGRFRDRNLLLSQVEYRMPLFGRIEGAAFAAAGTVAPRMSELDPLKPLIAGGFGLRFVYDRKEHIVIRMDVGFGKDSSGVYFSIYEAF